MNHSWKVTCSFVHCCAATGSCAKGGRGFSSTAISTFTWESSLDLLSEGATFRGTTSIVWLDKILFSSFAATVSVFTSPVALDMIVSFLAAWDKEDFSSLIALDEVCAVVDFDTLFLSEARREGRDLRCGFFWRTGLGPLLGLLSDTFSSRLKRANLEPLLLFPSDSELAEVFLRPNLGDFGLVVGIYISNTHKQKMLNFLNDMTKNLHSQKMTF